MPARSCPAVPCRPRCSRTGPGRGRHARQDRGRRQLHPAQGLDGDDPRARSTIFAAPEDDLQHRRRRCRRGRRTRRPPRPRPGRSTSPTRAATCGWPRRRPPGEGWDERVSIAYETSPSEKAAVVGAGAAQGRRLDGDDRRRRGSDLRQAARPPPRSSSRACVPPAMSARASPARTAHRLTPERIQLLRDFVAESARDARSARRRASR